MKILIIGGTGTIGTAVVENLKRRHEIIIASLKSGDVEVDIAHPESIKKMYAQVGKVDAVIATVGATHFGKLTEMTDKQFRVGINGKLMGQINLVLQGINHVNDNGSFTLTTGILNDEPIPGAVNSATANAGIEGFAKAAAQELPRGIRINVVSPTVITEAMDKFAAIFRGYKPVPAAEAALAYEKSVEGLQTGKVFKVGY